MTSKKGKFTRALKSAAVFPVRAVSGSKMHLMNGGNGNGSGSNGGGSGRNNMFEPIPGEVPITLLKVQVIGCKDLLAKDRNGSSDPFVVVTLLNTRHQTPVSKRNVNPVYAEKEATFEFPIYLSLADKLGAIEMVIWDKDMLKKEYLGEVAFPLDEWFLDRESGGTQRPYAFDDPANTPLNLNIQSTRSRTHATGTIQIKLGFVPAPGAQTLMEYDEIYGELVKRSRPSLVSAPPTEGVGTVRSHLGGPQIEDDGGISSDDDDDEGDDYQVPPEFPVTATPPNAEEDSARLAPPSTATPPESTSASTLVPPGKKPSTGRTASGLIPRIKLKRNTASYDSNALSVPATPSEPGTPTGVSSALPEQPKKQKFRKSWARNGGGGYNFSAENDIVGLVMIEVQSAADLPRMKNMTRTGFDMDPFVVISFGKKVFRTRVIRHSLNPTWDEKLIFHVRRYETSFRVQFSVLDWDKLSSNDHVGDASFDLKEIVDIAPKCDPQTGLYDAKAEGDHPMTDFKLALGMQGKEGKYSPVLNIRAKYQPYDALRQQFWRYYIKQYDTDDTGRISHLELTSMLDSLGSTLTRTTVNSFFTRYGKNPHEDEITVAEAILCLETELCKPDDEKRRVDADDSLPDTAMGTPIGDSTDALNLDQLNFAGPAGLVVSDDSHKPDPLSPHHTEPMQQPLHEIVAGDAQAAYSSGDESSEASGTDARAPATNVPTKARRGGRFRRAKKHAKSSSSADNSSSSNTSNPTDDPFERVINVKNCPICHRPRLNSKAEVDIIQHIACCASQDWAKIDRIVVGNFVTASQAQRKWYSKIITKIGAGNYKLGANSANIIVQNRMTGQLEEEKMQVYVRLGIRLLYKGAKGRMEGGRARRLLKSLSIKQGLKYDNPASARDIPSFIEYHRLNVDEIRDPLESFTTFNQFFYRHLKASARPIEDLMNPYRLVSAADCRLMTFETVDQATRLWIKGREFSVARLLGDAHKDDAHRFIGGALAIFRLAPQDYHRFHSPVDGKVGNVSFISGEYYTVNPQAIRTTLDVYGENARKIVPIDSPQFGKVMAVCIGAMMVGSILITAKEGDELKRGDELGYFAFGGSTVVVLFEKGRVQWDEDLAINAKASLETLVRVGMGLGTGTRK